MQLPSAIQTDSVVGETIEVGGVRVTPEARAVVLRLPFGGWVWNRPVAVLVERDGETRRVPIHDPVHIARAVTGLALALFATLSLFAVARRLVARSRALFDRRQAT